METEEKDDTLSFSLSARYGNVKTCFLLSGILSGDLIRDLIAKNIQNEVSCYTEIDEKKILYYTHQNSNSLFIENTFVHYDLANEPV